MLIRMNRVYHYRVAREFLGRFVQQYAGCSSSCNYGEKCSDHDPIKKMIGNREIVCFGMNGQPTYLDSWDFPFPAIRYRECTPELMAMREKERGDWRTLTIEEKKYLYRQSFRQTFSEMQGPNTDWKCIIGILLISISLSFFLRIWMLHYVHTKGPDSFSPEKRIAQYYRQVEINANPFSGNWRPPGAELRTHPRNSKELEELKELERKKENQN